MASDPNGGVCLIRRVVIRNYKSIAACDVELGPLTFLVGPNGSGKSNFLDALRFVSDALRNSLDHAIRERGGFREVLRRSNQHPTAFGVRVDFQGVAEGAGHFAFTIEQSKDGFGVRDEECYVTVRDGLKDTKHFYRVAEGEVLESNLAIEPAGLNDRLYLVNVSGTPAFRPVYDALSKMGFYNLNPDRIRELAAPGSRDLLARDGSNLPGVLLNLSESNPRIRSRVEEYLSQIVPGITGIEPVSIGRREGTLFIQGRSDQEPVPFAAASMSDGTLRALGILVALFQGAGAGTAAPLLVGIEEPETALHPAATGVLIDAVRDATSLRQVLVTSHSPELLDHPSLVDSEILAVVAENGDTTIGHLDEAGRSVLRDHLFTAGDLLRMHQLRPEPSAASLKPEELELFGTGAPA